MVPLPASAAFLIATIVQHSHISAFMSRVHGHSAVKTSARKWFLDSAVTAVYPYIININITMYSSVKYVYVLSFDCCI